MHRFELLEVVLALGLHSLGKLTNLLDKELVSDEGRVTVEVGDRALRQVVTGEDVLIVHHSCSDGPRRADFS